MDNYDKDFRKTKGDDPNNRKMSLMKKVDNVNGSDSNNTSSKNKQFKSSKSNKLALPLSTNLNIHPCNPITRPKLATS